MTRMAFARSLATYIFRESNGNDGYNGKVMSALQHKRI